MNLLSVRRRKFDIVERIVIKLEKYAENLEGIVNARTAELEEEKRKTDMLLYRMLPRFVKFIYTSSI